MKQRDTIWKSAGLTRQFLRGVRGAIPLAEKQIEVMLRLLASRRLPVRRFLDLGCGDGVLGAAVLARHPKAAGVFADFSEPMLAACRERLTAIGGPRSVVAAGEERTQRSASLHTTLLVDYGKPSWVNAVAGYAPFDAIVSGFSIHHQPDRRKRALYREIYRLLAPGGWFVNVEHVAPATALTTSLFDQTMVESLHRQQPHLSRATIRRRFVKRADRTANILAPVENQCRWLRAAGFRDVDCYFKFYELAVFGGRKPNQE